jgi:hypothetical protein
MKYAGSFLQLMYIQMASSQASTGVLFNTWHKVSSNLASALTELETSFITF